MTLTLDKMTRYQCNQCKSTRATKYSLKRHIKNIHEGELYPCNKCEYKATEKGSLKVHISGVHNGGKIKCNQCVITQPQYQLG